MISIARTARSWLAGAAATVLLLWPEVSHACSVCFSSLEANRTAFIATTVMLSVLPPAMIGGLVVWLWRRSRQLERDELSHSARVAQTRSDRDRSVSEASGSLSSVGSI